MYKDNVLVRCSSSSSSCSGAYDEIRRMYAGGNASIALEEAGPGPHIAFESQRYAIPPAVHELEEELRHHNFRGTVCVEVNDRGEVTKPITVVQNRAQHVANHANAKILYLTSDLPEIEFGVHLGDGQIFEVHF